MYVGVCVDIYMGTSIYMLYMGKSSIHICSKYNNSYTHGNDVSHSTLVIVVGINVCREIGMTV